MKKHFFMSLFFTLTLYALCQAQDEIDYEAGQELRKAQKQLDSTYYGVLAGYKDDSLFCRKLVASQVMWLKYLDAQIDVKFPDLNMIGSGSTMSMCIAYYHAELILDRVKILKEWLIGEEEGDVCHGSLKIKPMIGNK